MSDLIKTFRGSKILITGHTGFKGSWLTIWLYNLGAEIYGISKGIVSKPSHYEVTNIKAKIKNFLVDIREKEKLIKTIKDIQPDFIFHLAAQSLVSYSYVNPYETWETNTLGTLNILEGIRKLNKKCVAVLITSDKCYENIEWVYGYRENDKLGGIDPYSASKAGAEIVINSYLRSFFKNQENIKIGVARAGNVIGGGDWAVNRIVPDCIKAWNEDKIAYLRSPNSTRPWQHVLEPLSGYLSLAINLSVSNNFHGEAFNFGPPVEITPSVENLVKKMSEHWEKVKWEIKEPDLENKFHESNLLKLNCDKAYHLLKWKPNWNFEETVKNTITWYKKFYENKSKEDVLELTRSQIYAFQKSAIKKDIF